jgi:hypothetical protein
MWLMTKYGFFSIVNAWKSKDEKVPATDKMMVRCRNSDHMVCLRERFASHLGQAEIITTENTDYPCRIIISSETAAHIMQELVKEMDYINFKNEVAEKRPKDKSYVSFLHDVWYKGLSLMS